MSLLLVAGVPSLAQPSATGDNRLPVAFPGAEGYGKYATGGRGGRVILVTNLDDSGPGSFRAAAIANGKRIIVFTVSGTIHLQSNITIKGDVTIAGQTAPGDGICLADRSVGIGGDNVIIRYLRFRMGDRHEKNEKVDGNGGNDAFGFTRKKNVIIDHCSLSWSTDEVLSVYSGDSTTLQWNIIAEPLNYSYHFEAGDQDFEHHGYGGIWGGQRLSAHHNLFAHCQNRTPRFNGIRTSPNESVDYRNNVIYNWGGNNVYAGEGGSYNIVNNYYKYGPETKKSVRSRICNPGRTKDIPFGSWYVAGNTVDLDPEVTDNNRQGVHFDKDVIDQDTVGVLQSRPFAMESLPEQSAREAYTAVLLGAGASFRRDTLDARIVQDVRLRSGRFIDVQGGFPHGTPYEQSAIAWPVLQALQAPIDHDQDGMPDDWEKAKGLNPDDPKDAAGYQLDRHYTNIEVYSNSLLEREPSWSGLTQQRDTSYNIHSEYRKLLKNYPDLSIARVQPSKGVKVKKGLVYCRRNRHGLAVDVFYPSEKKTISRKTIILVHGGGWRSGSREMMYPLAQRLAALGYVCFVPEYRLSTEAVYPAALHDLKACVRWVRQSADKYDLDTDGIVIAGHSAGGQLAALLGVTNDQPAFTDVVCNTCYADRVQAIVDIDGTLSFVHKESGEGDDSKKVSAATHWFAHTKKEYYTLWERASPLSHAGPHTPPVLFLNSAVARMHAGQDDFIRVLDQYGIRHAVKQYAGAPHSFCLFEPWINTTVQDIDEFIQNLFAS